MFQTANRCCIVKIRIERYFKGLLVVFSGSFCYCFSLKTTKIKEKRFWNTYLKKPRNVFFVNSIARSKSVAFQRFCIDWNEDPCRKIKNGFCRVDCKMRSSMSQGKIRSKATRAKERRERGGRKNNTRKKNNAR